MLKIQPMYEDVIVPFRATSQSIGLDVHAYIKTETGRPNNMIVAPRQTRAIPTGLIVAPPPGYAVFMCSRSGLARNQSIFVTNAPGVIDPDYRGEVVVLLYNGGHESYYVRHEDRIGQLVLLPVAIPEFEMVDSLDLNTERGADGFGSSGR